MTLEHMRTAREMRMMKRLRGNESNPIPSSGAVSVTSLKVLVEGEWVSVFVPGIDDPDDTELYIY